jgi:Leucine-rich repeat (LRR) protein
MTIEVKFEDNNEEFRYISFEELLKLDNYNDITYLYCWNNNLTSLPTLPSSLTELWCGYNKLTSLPTLPSSLTKLECNWNNLTSLPTLPSSLVKLYCNNNKLTSLPTLPFSLTELCCRNNQINSKIDDYFKEDWRKYRKFQQSTLKEFANKLGSWFLECKYNPKYKYCRRRLTKEYKELFGEV